MISGTTSTGFTYEVNENISNDWRFVRALADIEAGDDIQQVIATVNLVNLLIGTEGERRLCDHVTTEDGSVPVKALMAEVAEILSGLRDKTKNS